MYLFDFLNVFFLYLLFFTFIKHLKTFLNMCLEIWVFLWNVTCHYNLNEGTYKIISSTSLFEIVSFIRPKMLFYFLLPTLYICMALLLFCVHVVKSWVFEVYFISCKNVFVCFKVTVLIVKILYMQILSIFYLRTFRLIIIVLPQQPWSL